jgi:GT2 family glycosyltransferase
VRVSVGVHVHAEPERLAATIRALGQPSAHDVEILLLPDGPDAATRNALTGFDLPQLGTDDPQGPPACFNRLAAASKSDVVILLESGAIPARSALDRLVDALGADPRNGIGGPSTNDAWNEQRTVPARSATPAAVAHAGKWTAARFGNLTRSAAPLHGLSDFCYAVRREVIAAIGGADDGYALGPCWEMEYSTRAWRAGFRDLWVCGAYVYRAPFTARRRLEESQRFEASRRRYQDSLCALQLLKKGADYAPHCRGEECEHFAPPALIRMRQPLPPQPAGRPLPPQPAGLPRPAHSRPARWPRESQPPAQLSEPQPQTAEPRERLLVSCVMPTGNRADFALQAVALFQAQDYEQRELIIVDDGDDHLVSKLPDDPRVRYVRSPSGESIGAKRNRACAQARGAFIAQWDDDDWYGPRRLSAQLAPLLDGRADVTGLRATVFMELDAWRFWTVTDQLHRRLFTEDVHGGTLVFARRVWERLAQYPPRSLAEDAAFLSRAHARGARIERLNGSDLFVYVRHGRNAWRFGCGEFLDRSGWSTVTEPPLPAADRAFYAARSSRAGRHHISHW